MHFHPGRLLIVVSRGLQSALKLANMLLSCRTGSPAEFFSPAAGQPSSLQCTALTQQAQAKHMPIGVIPAKLLLLLQISILVAWRSGGLLGLLHNFQARSCLETRALRMRHIPQIRSCMTAWRCWSLASHLEQLRRALAYISKKVLLLLRWHEGL